MAGIATNNGRSAILWQHPFVSTLDTALVNQFSKSAGGFMKKYIIEREVPQIGTLEGVQLCGVATKSNDALRKLAPHIQWVESFVAKDKTFCVYLAEDESFIRQHAELSGFPANKITEIYNRIDPATASQSW
jgi:hypothetical protein